MDSKKLLKRIKFIVCSLIIICFSTLVSKELAFITNQESNMLDVIDLSTKEKIQEIELGKKPAAIFTDSESGKIFVSNPDSNNISVIDPYDDSHYFLEAGNSPLGISFDNSKKNIFVSNWYDGVISVIDFVAKKKKIEIKVGQSPAGIYFDKVNQKLYVANRESNNVSLINTENFEVLKSLNVQNSPFGVYSENYLDYVVVTNVQSSSISIIDKKNFSLLKNIKVGKWPYSAVHDKLKNYLYITNQRDDSISIIDMEKKEKVKTLFDVCEYPEGIDISYTQNLIVVACWFEDNIILINLDDFSLNKKISTSGGPRAFGNFILKK